jgi:hypothetical protein
MASKYWHLLSRKPSNEITGYVAFPIHPTFHVSTLIVDTTFWSIVFTFISLLVPVILKRLFPNYWGNLEKSKKAEFPSIIIALIHHAYVVPLAIKWIFDDFTMSDSDYLSRNCATKEAMITPFCFGYFISDTIVYVIPQLFIGKFEMLIHHFLFVSLSLFTLFASGEINKLIPHLLVCESTGLIFNTCTILRTAGFRNHPIVTLLENLFALFFLLFRSINMPLAFLAMFLFFDYSSLGPAQYTIPPICVLQWVWMYKIITIALGKRYTKNL